LTKHGVHTTKRFPIETPNSNPQALLSLDCAYEMQAGIRAHVVGTRSCFVE